MKISLLTLIFVFSALTALNAGERILQTPSFRIVIAHLCEEGCVSCDTIFYHGTNKRTNAVIALVGGTLHTMDSDGVTPNRFTGYWFVNGTTSYHVDESGLLTVTRNDEVIVEEKGVWE